MPSGKPTSTAALQFRRFLSPKTAFVLVAALGTLFALWMCRQLEPRVVGWARGWAAAFPQPPVALDVPAEPSVGVQGESDAADEEPEQISGAAPSGSAPRKRRRVTELTAPGVPSGVRISAATVLRLANARAMPATRFVPAHAPRPAGLELRGISGLGLGVQDGDVLSDVAGTPVTSLSTVVSLVLQVRARHAGSIGATLWRGSHSFPLQVEMPYPTASSASARTPAPVPVPAQ